MFAKLALIFLSVLLPALAFGQTTQTPPKACFENEIDPQTRKIYRGEDPYNADLEKLLAAEPPRPGMYSMYRTYNLVKAETPKANQLKNDKRAHCYMGCRIANDISVEAAEYAAWYKEHKDLTDCVKRSRFELKDIVATQVGIRIGEKNSPHADVDFCQQTCRTQVR